MPPRDVADVAAPVLRHRVLTTFNAEAAGITSDEIIRRLITKLAPKEDLKDYEVSSPLQGTHIHQKCPQGHHKTSKFTSKS